MNAPVHKYFLMTGSGSKGPFPASQLPGEGVTPDTYVWCKGMEDWQRAGDIDEIRRTFAVHLRELAREKTALPSTLPPVASKGVSERPSGRFSHPPGLPGLPDAPIWKPDLSHAPAPTIFIALLTTIFCFPPTGFVAVYLSYMARRTWIESQRSNAEGSKALYSNEEKRRLATKAHDYARRAKMWIGITFFLGFIAMAFFGKKNLF